MVRACGLDRELFELCRHRIRWSGDHRVETVQDSAPAHFAAIGLSSLVVAGFSAVLMLPAPAGPARVAARLGMAVIKWARRRQISSSVTGMSPLPGPLGRSLP
jgi:hypothetical protein